MSSWHSYGSIYNMGHRAVKDIRTGRIVVEEKVDGSQFSFGVFEGKLRMRSKGKEIDLDAPEKLFVQAVQAVYNVAGRLKEGWTYRGEYLSKPRHNTLAYDRIPRQHIAIFDIAIDEEDYIGPSAKQIAAERLGFETVPLLYEGPGDGYTLADLARDMDSVSFLGGQKIEGVVMKAYGMFGPDKKTLMAKHVSEAFKEVHAANPDWKKVNRADLVSEIGAKLNTPARFNKAVQHLRDGGALTNTPADIGPLMRELSRDIEKEEAEAIKEVLYNHFRKGIIAGAMKGFPEWYKQRLAEGQFNEEG